MRPRRDANQKRNNSLHLQPQSRRFCVATAGNIRHRKWLPPEILFMAGHSRKWMILAVTIWIQAFTGTNFDFSAYSSEMKSVLGISQVQLNYLAVASDLGKAVGWSSGLALAYLPLSVVLLVAAIMGFFGYGLQWLVLRNFISLPYFVVFLLCVLAGVSICWFNTVCFALCIQNFPDNQPLALSLTLSFNGVSAALYTLAANAINPLSDALYLLLNAVLPLLTSIVALVPILRQPPLDPLPPEAVRRDFFIFLLLNVLAVVTGIYLLFLRSTDLTTARILCGGAVVLLILPLGIPSIIYARDWFPLSILSSFSREGSGFVLVDVVDHEELISSKTSKLGNGVSKSVNSDESTYSFPTQTAGVSEGCCKTIIEKDQLAMIGEEHTAQRLIRRLDFWLYYIAYFCAGTLGLVYSNNLGQIAQSLGQTSMTSTLITLYSSFSFFGRLLSATPDILRGKIYLARTGWFAIALFPFPFAFFLLAASGSEMALVVGTALVGLTSGFRFAGAVQVTSELFGTNSVGVNHNLLVTNIPIGSFLYGYLAALVYDAYATGGGVTNDIVVCMGRQCYFLTFVWWGCVSVVGLAASVLLFLRTQPAYDRFEHKRISSTPY
ncbi:protein NUCLEAR FUSION DEFECTIVE 4-like [Cornus florida]|uniref:protein NUCLEAR FUSION DEFECTIVE 4-like n=1 Tax=Cornus florida TaxID=4283 RepID=UPI00289BC553|nr:protein NUCLEAR FUSION DEFECTIVE 4-like [Cornus florida]